MRYRKMIREFVEGGKLPPFSTTVGTTLEGVFMNSVIDWHPDIAIVRVDDSRSTKDECHMAAIAGEFGRLVVILT
jgi:hypothetical protein